MVHGRIIFWIAVLVQVIFFTILLRLPARSDDLPKGLGHPQGSENHWYDHNCCNFTDCEPVETGAIMPGKDGYFVHFRNSAGREVKGFMAYGDPRIRLSRDAREHACSGHALGGLYCIYVLIGM